MQFNVSFFVYMTAMYLPNWWSATYIRIKHNYIAQTLLNEYYM